AVKLVAAPVLLPIRLNPPSTRLPGVALLSTSGLATMALFLATMELMTASALSARRPPPLLAEFRTTVLLPRMRLPAPVLKMPPPLCCWLFLVMLPWASVEVLGGAGGGGPPPLPTAALLLKVLLKITTREAPV